MTEKNLPPSAKAHLDRLGLPAELREIAERIYPDGSTDAAIRRAKERKAEQEEIQRRAKQLEAQSREHLDEPHWSER